MSDVWTKYFNKKRLELSDATRRAKTMTFCYFFILPYAVLFLTFNILPMITSMYYSFTNFNINTNVSFA